MEPSILLILFLFLLLLLFLVLLLFLLLVLLLYLFILLLEKLWVERDLRAKSHLGPQNFFIFCREDFFSKKFSRTEK
jgi:uncharacterized protein (DUF58 family)